METLAFAAERGRRDERFPCLQSLQEYKRATPTDIAGGKSTAFLKSFWEKGKSEMDSKSARVRNTSGSISAGYAVGSTFIHL